LEREMTAITFSNGRGGALNLSIKAALYR